MTTYLSPPPHEQLKVFFNDFFREIRNVDHQNYLKFMLQAEEEFKRLGYREENSSGVENILIVRLDLIGDMILTSGFIREVRANFPKARITLICSPVTFPIVEFCPYVNEVLSLDKNSLAGDIVDAMEKIAVFCRDNLWHKKFSIAFSPRWFSDTLAELLLVWLSGARERIGYGTFPFYSWLGNPPPDVIAMDNFFLTKNVVTPQEFVSDPERNFYLLVATGFKVNELRMELFYSAEEFQYASELLKDIPPSAEKILLGLGGSDLNKKYPAEKYLVALREMAEKDFVFVIVGGKSELDDAVFLENNLPSGKILNLAGKTTLRETEAIIAQMDYYIGHDTGVMHMAAASKVPVLGIYREAADRENILPPIYSGFRRFPPWQTKAIALRPEHPLGECATLPLTHGHCHHKEPHCITQIPPEGIIAGFEKLQSI